MYQMDYCLKLLKKKKIYFTKEDYLKDIGS